MSYNKSLFEGVPKKNQNKSNFNLSHEYKAQMIPGKLIPILTMETMPGDEWDIDSEFMFRFSPLYYPIMHKLTMRADYFYVPNRILWTGTTQLGEDSGWQSFIMNLSGNDHPVLDVEMEYYNNAPELHVGAFMGLPTIDSTTVDASTTITGINALPFSAYLKIWDEYYRNPQLETARWFPLNDGDNTADFNTAWAGWGPAVTNQYFVAPSKWEKDYFTSALPTPQIGEAVKIPSLGLEEDGTYTPANVYQVDGTIVAGPKGLGVDASGQLQTSDGASDVVIETTATIKQLRIAEVLQSYYERIMKVGQRYRDFMKGLFENDPLPGIVDVPVLLGSKFGRVAIADVMTSAYTDTTSDNERRTGDYVGQANLYEPNSGKISYFCREHGWIMCILQVNANTSYGQGIERFWRRTLPTDYPLDMFAGIGDQEILKEELLYNPVTTVSTKNQDTFGYIPRFSEMRYVNNKHIGALNYTFGLSQHLGRYWDASNFVGATYDTIEINEAFVTASTLTFPDPADGFLRLTDVFRALPSQGGESLPTEAIFYAHIFHSIWVKRALPYYSTPQL